MKTTSKYQSFLAKSSGTYFKFGLATSILFAIAAFKIPIYAETPNWTPYEEDPSFKIMYVTEIHPVKENIVVEEKKAPVKQSPVVQLIITNDPTPDPQPTPIAIEPLPVSSTVTQKILVDPIPAVKKTWEFVETMPSFKGGQAEMYKFFGKNINYHPMALEHGLEGKVYVRFIVDPKGNISNVEIAKGVDPLLDNEALRVVKSMPTWTPGIQNGEKVSVVMVLPINFVIQ